MSFEITPVQGTVTELDSDLAAPTQHEREDLIIPIVKKAIADIVDAMGGYLSVSCNGNLNPLAGETGDLVQLYITSLPVPDSAPVEKVETEIPLVEETTESIRPIIPTEVSQQETQPSEQLPPGVSPIEIVPIEPEATTEVGTANIILPVTPPAETAPAVVSEPNV